MRHLRTIFSLLVLGIVLGLLASPAAVQAQDIAPVSASDQVQQLAEQLFTLIYNATYIPFAAGLVVLLTALAKRVLSDVPSSVLSLTFTVFVWVIWLVANEMGYGSQLESIVTALTALGSAILGISLTPMAAGRLYEEARERDVALFGYSRTPPQQVVG